MKAVVFDFDYTLGDSTEGILECLSYGLERLGFPPAGREDMRRTIGLSLGPALEALTGCADRDKAAEFTRLFMEKADEVMVARSELFPGSEEVLRDIRSRGLRTGIVTTKASYRIWKILDKCAACEGGGAVGGGAYGYAVYRRQRGGREVRDGRRSQIRRGADGDHVQGGAGAIPACVYCQGPYDIGGGAGGVKEPKVAHVTHQETGGFGTRPYRR